jgi:SWI/SNF-related matrix-associated actin-dependent regulator of chromatin subfamily A3
MQDETGKPLVPLPPVEMIVVRVTLDDETRKTYNAIEAESRRRFNEYMSGTSQDSVAVKLRLNLVRKVELIVGPDRRQRTY